MDELRGLANFQESHWSDEQRKQKIVSIVSLLVAASLVPLALAQTRGKVCSPDLSPKEQAEIIARTEEAA